MVFSNCAKLWKGHLLFICVRHNKTCRSYFPWGAKVVMAEAVKKNDDVVSNPSKMKSEPQSQHLTVTTSKQQKQHHGKRRQTLKLVKYRQKLALSGKKVPVPSNIDLQVVATGANGTAPCLSVNTNQNRYLFNCGEGTQRLAMEHRLKLSKVENILFTHRSWQNIGGLLGMALSLNDINVPKITLHGPPGVEKIATASRGFSQVNSLKIEKREVSAGPYEDDAMRIEYVPLVPHAVPEDPCEPEAKRRRLSQEKDVAMAYICKPHRKPGELSLVKCVELGVPRGPYMGQLKDGETVTLDDGTVVKPEDVLSPPEACKAFIVVECPSTDYLDSLLSNENLQKCQSDSSADEQTVVVVHFTPPAILEQSQYQEWMNRFAGDTQHLIVNKSCSGIAHHGAYRIQAMLNLLYDGIFPLLSKQKPAEQSQDTDSIDNTDQNIVLGATNLKYCLRPQKGFNRELCKDVDNEESTQELLEDNEFQEELSKVKKSLSSHVINQGGDGQYPELVFLGTGSAIPSKVRNVSAILLHLSEDQCVLLDCGEGTLGQLCRHYGNQVEAILRKLRFIFISHLHADHHMGVFGVAAARKEARKDDVPLTILAPAVYKSWMDTFDEEVLPIKSVLDVVPLEMISPSARQDHLEEYDLLLHQSGFTNIEPVHVIHRQYPHGIVLNHQDGWKLVYSGDTMPSPALVKAGQGCDILIHEATMEDDLAEEAVNNRHSTTSQALQVGTDMNAKFIILTHFSQRYAKIPIFNDKFNNKVGIAFDNMRVKWSDVSKLPYFTQALKAMFADKYAEMQEKTEKRMLQKQRAKQKVKDSKISKSERDSNEQKQ